MFMPERFNSLSSPIAFLLSGDQSILITPIRDSLEGHLLVFAAEEARAKGTVVDVRNYEQSLRKS
jgi:hypothetical protein